ncbi:methyl-accepting chemotaxis protein [Chamaesiphon minutus]|uniref:Methyl-accepting chemotaxis protein n=1 Tax=Chamaesiphon minutus (strain ATCC 27169 / PCC 6605) TaxID=1173020 RepID=K9UKK4_CHAP6|nr:methyl-accepting chemotaxis protein [Chamaesiphon minutus]AFY95335.1 methyl-accepting chemotaxis protein [Chamaesiphon minutus PCC 6605]
MFQTNLLKKATNFSFKTKAIGLAILLAVIPILGTGAFAAFLSAQNIRAQETQQQRLLARSLSQNLTRFIGLRSVDIQNISVLAPASDLLVLAKTPIAEQERLLKKAADRYKFYDTIAIVDLQGKPIAASNRLNIRPNYGNLDYFKKTIASGQPQISRVDLNTTNNRAYLYFTAPTFDRNDKMVAVILARMPVAALEVVTKTFGDDQNNWAIFDRSSRKIIQASQRLRAGRSTEDLSSFQQYRSIELMTVEDTDRYNSRPQLISYKAIVPPPGAAEMDLVAVMSEDIEILLANERPIWVAIGLGSLFAGALTAGVAFFLSDRVTKYIQRAISTITISASEIIDTVQTQEITVNEQANSAIATTDNVNELESISTTTAEQAAASATGARQALSLAEEGTQAVQKTINEMSDLRERVDEIAVQIANLGEQTGQITNVSDLVSDLAKQTNMLALKAAVEAARAGEQGKGFGVVAGEIRKLADESKKSAQKINDLATDIQTSINRTVIVTDRGTKTVTEGIQLAETTAATFIGVADAVNNVFLNSQQISASTQRQATAIQQVLGAMNTISKGSQESAVGMHKVKTSTRELNLIADELQAVVN